MHLSPLSRSARLAFALGAPALALSTAGCGGADDDAPPPNPQPPGIVAPEGASDTATTTPETKAEGAGTVSPGGPRNGGGDYRPPAAAAANGLPHVSTDRGVRLEAAKGKKTVPWSVVAKRGDEGAGELCVNLKVPGPYDPDPTCQTGELIALSFYGGQGLGPALSTVVQAPLSRREPPTQLVVAGIVGGEVKKVQVRYGIDLHRATLSDEAIDVPLDTRMAKLMSGATAAEIKRLPDPVSVRVFSVSFPRDAGNPPRVATPEQAKADDDGTVTLRLN